MHAGVKVRLKKDGSLGTVAAILDSDQVPLGFSRDQNIEVHWNMECPGHLPTYVRAEDLEIVQ